MSRVPALAEAAGAWRRTRIRAQDPGIRARRVLLRGEETLDDKATQRLWSLLELGDPGAEVAIAYRIGASP